MTPKNNILKKSTLFFINAGLHIIKNSYPISADFRRRWETQTFIWSAPRDFHPKKRERTPTSHRGIKIIGKIEHLVPIWYIERLTKFSQYTYCLMQKFITSPKKHIVIKSKIVNAMKLTTIFFFILFFL